MQRLKQGIAELKNQRVSTAKSEGGESVSPNTVGASFSSLFHNIRIRTSQNMSVFLRLVKEKLSLHFKKSVKLGVVTNITQYKTFQ